MGIKTVWTGFYVCMVLTGLGGAQTVPQLVNYQGKLTDANGVPLEAKEYVISISIFGHPTGGTPLWGPQMFDGQAGTGHGVKVSVIQGFFNVVLGPKDTAGRDITVAFATKDAYLEVTVEGGTPIAPRQQILTTPYAISSDDENPPGTILAFAGKTVPPGWFLCDGTALSKTQYARLWNAIDTTWGDGKTNPDGTPSTGTDFNLPNLQGRFLRGADNRTTGREDPDAPRTVGSLQEDDIKSHNHLFLNPAARYGALPGLRGGWQMGTNYWSDDPVTAETGGPETRPKNFAVNYIIKY